MFRTSISDIGPSLSDSANRTETRAGSSPPVLFFWRDTVYCAPWHANTSRAWILNSGRSSHVMLAYGVLLRLVCEYPLELILTVGVVKSGCFVIAARKKLSSA